MVILCTLMQKNSLVQVLISFFFVEAVTPFCFPRSGTVVVCWPCRTALDTFYLKLLDGRKIWYSFYRKFLVFTQIRGFEGFLFLRCLLSFPRIWSSRSRSSWIWTKKNSSGASLWLTFISNFLLSDWVFLKTNFPSFIVSRTIACGDPLKITLPTKLITIVFTIY